MWFNMRLYFFPRVPYFIPCWLKKKKKSLLWLLLPWSDGEKWTNLLNYVPGSPVPSPSWVHTPSPSVPAAIPQCFPSSTQLETLHCNPSISFTSAHAKWLELSEGIVRSCWMIGNVFLNTSIEFFCFCFFVLFFLLFFSFIYFLR